MASSPFCDPMYTQSIVAVQISKRQCICGQSMMRLMIDSMNHEYKVKEKNHSKLMNGLNLVLRNIYLLFLSQQFLLKVISGLK